MKYMHNEESEHKVSMEDHEECCEILDELLEHLDKADYPEHIKVIADSLKKELDEDYEDAEEDEDGRDIKEYEHEDDIPDEELIRAHKEEMEGKPKLLLKIKIKPKR